MSSIRNIRHDPVQRDVYVTSKYRTLGGVEWFREAQFSKDGSSTSQQLTNTWSVLANISKATAPAAVERPKRRTIVPDFSKMSSHEDVLNKQIEKATDNRPPLNPQYDDKFKAVVKMVKPKKSKEMLERELREKRKAEAERRKEQNESGAFGMWNKRKASVFNHNNDGDENDTFDDDENADGADFHYVIEEVTDENGNTVKRKVKKKGKDPRKGNGKGGSPLKLLLKDRPDPKTIHGTAVLNAAERFPPSYWKKFQKNKKRNNINSKRNTRGGRNPDRLSDFLGDENDEEKSRAMKKEFETITLKCEGDEAEERKRKRQENAANKFVEYDYNKDPEGVGRIVDFSSKPFTAAPAWSFGTPSTGENPAQRKKRQEEETRAAEAEYAFNAKMEKQNRIQQALMYEQEKRTSMNNNQNNPNNSSFMSSEGGANSSLNNITMNTSSVSAALSHPRKLLGAAIDFSRGAGRQTGSERRTSRKEQFLELFRNRDAKMSAPGSPFFHNIRARTPEINSGCLLGAGGTNSVVGIVPVGDQKTTSSLDLSKNAEASLIRSRKVRQVYKSHARDLVKRAMSATPDNLMKRSLSGNSPSGNNNNNNNNSNTRNRSPPTMNDYQSLSRRSPAYNLLLNVSMQSEKSGAASLNGSVMVQQQQNQNQQNLNQSQQHQHHSTKPPLADKRLHFSATPIQHHHLHEDDEDEEEF